MEVRKLSYGKVYIENGVMVEVAEGSNWATIYTVWSNNPNKGYCQKLLSKLKEIYKDTNFGCSIALNSAMRHILNKLNIKERTNEDD